MLPTHLREKWSLRRFADVFDGVGEIPPEPDGIEDELIIEDDTVDNHRAEHHKQGKRRGGKRVLLATVNADSTIVYYIVHEGIVKPRQN